MTMTTETLSPAPEESSPASAQSIDRVFEYAWHRCNAFDDRSSQLKKRYRLIRESIVFITWFTTLLAVLAALTSFVAVLRLIPVLGTAMVFGYTLLTMPFNRIKGSNLLEIGQIYIRNIIDRWHELVLMIGMFMLTYSLIAVVEYSLAIQTRDDIFKYALIILPLFSAGLLTFASRFEAGISWVGFRLVSEAIRRKIYELRVKRSLEPLTQADLEDLREHVLNQRTMLDEMGIVTPLWGERYQPNGELTRPLWTDDPEDDGYAPLPVNHYVNYRVVPQTNYYRNRIQKDYGKTRSYRGWILYMGALGAFLAAADYGEFVAVTVAGVTALQALLSLREHEHSYNIHVRTLLQLEDRIASYYIQLRRIVDKDTLTNIDRQTVLDYVQSVEDILDEERRMWKNSVLQGQEATESSIAQLVSSTTTDFKVEETGDDDSDDAYQSFYALIETPSTDEKPALAADDKDASTGNNGTDADEQAAAEQAEEEELLG